MQSVIPSARFWREESAVSISKQKADPSLLHPGFARDDNPSSLVAQVVPPMPSSAGDLRLLQALKG